MTRASDHTPASRSWPRRVRLVLIAAVCALAIAAPAIAATPPPIEVKPSITIRNQDWLPLSASEMKRAAGDAAFDRLTDAGRLRFSPHARAGKIALEIALVGPSETAGLTITLDSDAGPTLVAAASISVRGLDHAGIHSAFQHVGRQAAERLVSKLDLLAEVPAAKGSTRLHASLGDPARRARFDSAQRAKREGTFDEARSGFESVVSSGASEGDSLADLAADELRYGLPLFEARHALNELGRLGGRPGSQGVGDRALERAGHLYRQILAENALDPTRVMEAERALDEISVARSALANAWRANALSRATTARFAFLETLMSEGACPNLDRARALVSSMGRGFSVVSAVDAPRGAGRTYRLRVPDSTYAVDLFCNGHDIRVSASSVR